MRSHSLLLRSLCSLVVAATTAGVSPRRAPARLSSVFVSLAVRPDWNTPRWATLVADLKAIGVDNIILADCVTESKAWYPSKIPGLTHADADVVCSQHRRPDAAAQPAAPPCAHSQPG
jgi:hypothetical protein